SHAIYFNTSDLKALQNNTIVDYTIQRKASNSVHWFSSLISLPLCCALQRVSSDFAQHNNRSIDVRFIKTTPLVRCRLSVCTPICPKILQKVTAGAIL